MHPKVYAERMAVGYVDCALWSDLDWTNMIGDNPQPLDDVYSPDDLAPETWKAIASLCSEFCDACWDDLSAWEPEQAGLDLHLTRNRHGAGFWDRGRGDAGDRLTAAAHAYGEAHLYVGDDGSLYLS